LCTESSPEDEKVDVGVDASSLEGVVASMDELDVDVPPATATAAGNTAPEAGTGVSSGGGGGGGFTTSCAYAGAGPSTGVV
jgi:hypothetical protein